MDRSRSSFVGDCTQTEPSPKDARPLRLAIVHDWLTGYRGGEKCLEALCRHFPDARLYTLVHNRGSASPAIERMRITTSFLNRLPWAARHYRHYLPLMPAAIESLAIDEDVDLVVSFSHAVAKSVRPPAGVPHVSYCFTPMRYAWHQRAAYFGEANDRAGWSDVARWPIDAARRTVLNRLCQWDRDTNGRVDRFLAASQTVAGRIKECYGRASTVLHPPVDTDYFTPSDFPRDDYYLYLSALVPYKRVDLAVAACQRLGRRLVVVGAGPEHARLRRMASERVEFTGWASQEVVREHLRRCRALLFPGVEDFGIVPVEAMACGAPVIALGQGGATETLLPASETRRGTAIFFDEPSVESLCQAMTRFERDTDACSPTLARQRALMFSAPRFERELVGYLRGVVHSGSGLPRVSGANQMSTIPTR